MPADRTARGALAPRDQKADRRGQTVRETLSTCPSITRRLVQGIHSSHIPHPRPSSCLRRGQVLQTPQSSLSPSSFSVALPVTKNISSLPSSHTPHCEFDSPDTMDSEPSSSTSNAESISPPPRIPAPKPMLTNCNPPEIRNLIVEAVSTIQQIWCLAPEQAFPPALIRNGPLPQFFPGYSPLSSSNSINASPNPANAPSPNPIHEGHLPTPPSANDPFSEPEASPFEPAMYSFGSDSGTPDDSPNPDMSPADFSIPHGQALGITFGDSPSPALSSYSPGPPTVGANHSLPSHQIDANMHHGTTIATGATTLTAQTIPASMENHAAQRTMLYFMNEIIRRSRAPTAIFEVAMCYVTVLRDFIRILLRDRQELIDAAAAQNLRPETIDQRGVMSHPLLDPRRTFLAALVLAFKFYKDGAYKNSAWKDISGLPVQEVSRCEMALVQTLGWRLWVGHIPPSPRSLRACRVLGDPTAPAPVPEASEGIVVNGRPVTPPLPTLSLAPSFEVPGDGDLLAARFIEAAKFAELHSVPVPRNAPHPKRSGPEKSGGRISPDASAKSSSINGCNAPRGPNPDIVEALFKDTEPPVPHVPDARVPLSSIVGAFRPTRTPPPSFVASMDNSTWYPPPNHFRRGLTPPKDYELPIS